MRFLMFLALAFISMQQAIACEPIAPSKDALANPLYPLQKGGLADTFLQDMTIADVAFIGVVETANRMPTFRVLKAIKGISSGEIYKGHSIDIQCGSAEKVGQIWIRIHVPPVPTTLSSPSSDAEEKNRLSAINALHDSNSDEGYILRDSAGVIISPIRAKEVIVIPIKNLTLQLFAQPLFPALRSRASF